MGCESGGDIGFFVKFAGYISAFPVSKVIKILVSFFSALALGALMLLTAVSLALEIPAVQNFITDKAAELLSEKLGTRISIGSVRLKFVSRASIKDLYIEDMHGDTLLYAGEIDAGIRNPGIAGGAVELGAVKLDRVRFYMYQTDRRISNLAEILEKLKSDKPREKKGGFRLSAASLAVNDLKYRYRKLEPDDKPYGVNFTDVDVLRLDMQAGNISVADDSVSMRIGNIAVSERSGLRVESLSSDLFSISGRGMSFIRLNILTPDSRVAMNYLHIKGESWKSYGDFIHRMHMSADVVNSTASFRTISYFAPTLREWRSVYRNFSGQVEGTVADMHGFIERAGTLSTELRGVEFSMKGLPDAQNTLFKFTVGSVTTNAGDAMFIMRDITGRELPPNGAAMLGRLGTISFGGNFDGSLSRFHAKGNLHTGRGAADVDLSFLPAAKGRTLVDGSLTLSGVDLGVLLDNPSLGRADVSGSVKGGFDAHTIDMDADAEVGSLHYNGYTYTGINMKGRMENRKYTGKITSADPNMAFDFDGTLDFNDSTPHYDFDLRLRRADLHRLNFNRRDSVSVLACRLEANASGSTLDDITGRASIDDVMYVSPWDSVSTGRIEIAAENSAQHKKMTMNSSFADIQFQSRLSYSNLFEYLTWTLNYFIPTLDAPEKTAKNGAAAAANAGDYYFLKMKIKEANSVAGQIVPGLILAQGTELSFMLNPLAEDISVSLQSEYIEWKRNYISNLSFNSRNDGDSLALFARADELFASGFIMPGLSVIGGIKDNKVNLSSRFSDTQRQISALVALRAAFDKTPEGMQRITMRLEPSYFTNQDQTWRLSSGAVVYDSTRTSVERFRIVSAAGELTASGVMSRSPQDTLRLRLSNFNLQPFSQLSQRMGYTVSGLTNGYADMAAAFGRGMLTSNIRFDSLKVNGVAVTPLLFDARWDFRQERVRMALVDRARADTLVRAFYLPADKRYMAAAKVKGVDLSLLDPLLKGILRESRGVADVDVSVISRKGSPEFEGTVSIPRLTTTVDFTGVPYSFADASISIKDNVFRLNSTQIADGEGNRAPFEAHFSFGKGRYEYELHAMPRNLLALNTTSADNELFNGHVYASGAFTLKGDKRGVSMDIAATSADRSSFFMSLGGKSGFTDDDFITFIAPKKEEQDNAYYKRRMEILSGQAEKSKSGDASSLAINMALTVRPNTDFQLVIDPAMGKGIKARGNGVLNITVDPKNKDFRMYGDYEITEGSYNFNLEQLIDRTLDIEPGSSIKWSGDPADATLDVTATYKLRASLAPLTGADSPYANRKVNVECRLKLSDRLSKPTTSFDVVVPETSPEVQSMVSNALNTPELMTTQFLWLLVTKNFDSGGAQGTMSGSATAWDFFTSQLSNALSNKYFTLGIGYRPKDDMSSSEVDFDFSTSLVSERLFIDIEGNYNTEDNPASVASANANNLTGDFSVRYLVDKTGNIQAKAFSRTVDTFDENQGLQESGVGIYYHEDFNTFADIMRNIRARFGGRGKRERKDGRQPEKLPAEAVTNGQTDKTTDKQTQK